MKWSEEVRVKAKPIYEAILRHPFVEELASGTLSQERFLFYIRQDAVYIEQYSRVLAHIASRLQNKEWMEEFLNFASQGIIVERALHASYLKEEELAAEPTPTCLLYTSYEASKAMDPVEVEIASILPCFVVYKRVGEEILKRSSSDNPYRRWIETYGDDTFAESTSRASAISDALAEEASQEVREAMTKAFQISTKMEWMFWDSAYRLEKWDI